MSILNRKSLGYLILSIVIFTIFSQARIITNLGFPANDGETIEQSSEPISYNFKVIGTYNQATKVVDVNVQGDLAFIADEDQGLVILNISQPENPTFLSKYQIEDESVYDIKIKNNTCYIAHGRAGLVILDITNISAINKKSRYDVGGTVWKLHLKDEIIFVVNRNYGIDIVDINDITAPFRISRYEGQPLDVLVQESLMIVAAGFSAGIEIVDIEDLANPVKKSEIKTELEDTVGLSISGENVFVATQENGLKIIDISNDRRPKVISYYNDEGPGRTWSVEVKGNFVYLADEKEGLEVLDITNIRAPKEIGQLIVPQGQTYDLAVKDDHIYLADYSNGLDIITWKVAQPNPVAESYQVIDKGSLNFNNSVGPFEIDTILGNETLGLNLSLLFDVGLKSPINITIEAPTAIEAGKDINLRVRITAEASKFWATFRGSLAFITPAGSATIASLEDAGIPSVLELAAFKTFIGENLTMDTNLQPFILWQQNLLNYTLKFIMTPYFNITGTAIVEGKINAEEMLYQLEWTKDKEELIIPITIPQTENNYSLLLEDFQFNIDDLRLDLYEIKFALIAEEIVELYNWTININELAFLNKQNIQKTKLGKIIFYPEQPNNRTLFFLDGIYPLGDYLIVIPFTKGSGLPLWAIILFLLSLILLLAIPWIIIIASSREKKPRQRERENE